MYRFLVEHGGDQYFVGIHGYKPNGLIGKRLLSAKLEEEDACAISKLLGETYFTETWQFTTVHKTILGIAKADVHIYIKTLSASCVEAELKRFDEPDIVDLLHGAGADINYRDVDEESLLLNAILKKDTCTARRLIELDADVNATSYSSRDFTFHFAVLFNHHVILPLLLNHGTNYTKTVIDSKCLAHI
ncbi:MAG: hypothetical protein Q9181_003392 [Wetmoreana brouardii]